MNRQNKLRTLLLALAILVATAAAAQAATKIHWYGQSAFGMPPALALTVFPAEGSRGHAGLPPVPRIHRDRITPPAGREP
ncbi:MAG: hypothetical protein AB1558_02630 [Thermodesulfobacteriota bacterium]